MQIDEVAIRPLAESDEDVVHRIRTSVDDAARPSRLEVRQRVGAGARKRCDACERPRRRELCRLSWVGGGRRHAQRDRETATGREAKVRSVESASGWPAMFSMSERSSNAC